MSTSVKFFHSEMLDAPLLNGVAGSIHDVLRSCLVTGFSLRTINTVVVSNGIATANVSEGHSYIDASVIEISGGPSLINGQHRITRVLNSSQFTFPLAVPDGSFVGLFGCKFAPCGWEQPFVQGSDTAVYRSTDPQSTRMFLSVVDSTIEARAAGYESMTDASVGQGRFPSAIQLAAGVTWPKANAANAGARSWVLVGDSRTFWLFVNATTPKYYLDGYVFGFGDIASFKAGDPYACAIFGSPTSISATAAAQTTSVSHVTLGSGTRNFYMARSYSVFGGSIACAKSAESYQTSDAFSGAVSSYAYPNPVNNSVLLSPILAVEAGGVLRGRLRGPLFVPQLLTVADIQPLSLMDGQGAYAGRKLMALRAGGAAGNASASVATMFMDVSGPWG